jgi:hypothetical protein
MPHLQSLTRGASGVCSLQWATAGRALLAGDASLARDSLSSQGLAGSLSDALYAVAAVIGGDLEALRRRQEGNLAAHLAHMRELLSRCRFRNHPIWSDYEMFFRANSGIPNHVVQPALQYGRL